MLNLSAHRPTKSGGSCRNFTTLYSVETSPIVKRSQEPRLGPLPSAQIVNRVRNLSKARARILELVANGPCTVSSLAMLTGQHENTIREHLDALVDEDLTIKYQSAEHLRGRPAWFYRLSDDRDQVRTGEYAGLASALAGSIARSSAHPGDDAIEAGRAWARELVRHSELKPVVNHGQLAKVSAIATRRKVISLLNRLGFAPKQNAGLTKNKLTRCPLLDATRQYPDIICNVHLGIVRGALSEFGATSTEIDKADLQPFSEPGACILRM
jgi:predicted ArsR family transcriptional regulator